MCGTYRIASRLSGAGLLQPHPMGQSINRKIVNENRTLACPIHMQAAAGQMKTVDQIRK